MAISTVTIRNLLGLNRRDGADKVQDNQFFTLQNWIPITKGLLYKKPGSTYDLPVDANGYFASAINAIARHYHQSGDRWTLYHCKPTSTPLPQPTADLTFAEITGGNIYAGGAVTTLRFCYDWVGLGLESNWNSLTRTGFLTVVDAGRVAIDAWNQPAHQTFTPSTNTKGVRVTVPAFPAGVRSANVFMAVGTSTQMTYVGTVNVSGGTLDVKCAIGSSAAASDAFGVVGVSPQNGGSLKAGNYYVALAYVTDSKARQDPAATPPGQLCKVSAASLLALGNGFSAIKVTHSVGTGSSTNGATYAHVFIGRNDCLIHPMVWAGIIKCDGADSITINSLPDNRNAQTCAANLTSGSATTCWFSGASRVGETQATFRPGFLLKKDLGGTLSELFFSRTEMDIPVWAATPPLNPFTAASDGGITALYQRQGYIRTDSDTGMTATTGTYSDPQFAALSGLTYFANGLQPLIQTDGKAMSTLLEKWGTILPPNGRFVLEFKQSLVTGGDGTPQVYMTNATQPNNFAAGGSGTSLRFMTLGTPFGGGLAAIGKYSYTSATDGPASKLLGFTKNKVWTTTNLPDPTSGIGAVMDELTGRVGCVAPRSLANTPLGTVFFGSDAEWYLIRGSGEPMRIGTSVLNVFNWMVGNDAAMKKVTAVLHDFYLKVCYPQASTSVSADAQLWADMRTSTEDPIAWFGPHIGTGVGYGAQFVGNAENDDNTRLCSQAPANGLYTMKLDDPSVYYDLVVGSPVISVLQTKTYRARFMNHFKRWFGALLDAYYDSSFTHSILVEGFADEFYAQVNRTLSTGAAIWDTTKWGQGQFADAMFRGVDCYFPGNLVGRTLYLKITHSNPAPFILAGAELPYKPERRTIV